MPVSSRRPPLRQRLTELLDLPKDIVLDLPRISIVGDLQLLVENHRGLLEYDPERVVIGMNQGRLLVRGKELIIGAVHADEMTITGQLVAIEFLR